MTKPMTTSQVAIYFTILGLAIGLLIGGVIVGAVVVTFIGMLMSLAFLGYTLWVTRKQA